MPYSMCLILNLLTYLMKFFKIKCDRNFIIYANEIKHERQYVKYYLDCLRKVSFHNLKCFGPKTFLHKNDAIFNFSKVWPLFQRSFLIKQGHLRLVNLSVASVWHRCTFSYFQKCFPTGCDLDLWPCDLELGSTSTSHQYQSYVEDHEDQIIRSWVIAKTII